MIYGSMDRSNITLAVAQYRVNTSPALRNHQVTGSVCGQLSIEPTVQVNSPIGTAS